MCERSVSDISDLGRSARPGNFGFVNDFDCKTADGRDDKSDVSGMPVDRRKVEGSEKSQLTNMQTNFVTPPLQNNFL